jgi:hypothetical protein
MDRSTDPEARTDTSHNLIEKRGPLSPHASYFAYLHLPISCCIFVWMDMPILRFVHIRTVVQHNEK